MPGYRTHVGGAVVAYVAVLVALTSLFIIRPPLVLAVEWFFFCILGSLFPDIDTKSKGQILFYKVVMLGLLVLLWRKKLVAFVWLALLSMVPVLSHHRGLFHRPWFVVLLPLLSAVLLAKVYPMSQKILLYNASFFALGALSHIGLDLFVSGIKRGKF